MGVMARGCCASKKVTKLQKLQSVQTLQSVQKLQRGQKLQKLQKLQSGPAVGGAGVSVVVDPHFSDTSTAGIIGTTQGPWDAPLVASNDVLATHAAKNAKGHLTARSRDVRGRHVFSGFSAQADRSWRRMSSPKGRSSATGNPLRSRVIRLRPGSKFQPSDSPV